MPSGRVDTTVNTQGLRELQRDLKKVAPDLQKGLQSDLRDVAEGVAREVNSRLGASSFSYRGGANGTRAYVRSVGRKAYVARFIDRGFHPRGSSTFVEGLNTVEQVLGDRQDDIIDGIGDAIDRAMDKNLKH